MNPLKSLIGLIVGSLCVLLFASAGPGVWWFDRHFQGYHFGGVPIVHWFSFTIKPGEGVQLASIQALEAAAAARAKTVEAQDVQIGAQAAQHDQQAQAAIVVRYRTITKEIHDVIPPAVDARFPVSLGGVRLFNAGAAGLDVSQFPLGAGQSDDSVASTSASALAAAINGNDAICAANAKQLDDLIGWNKTVSATQK